MLLTASPNSTKASKSGKVPATPPHSAAFHTAVRRPMTATAMLLPNANCEMESIDEDRVGKRLAVRNK
jgi:hypothetical protein